MNYDKLINPLDTIITIEESTPFISKKDKQLFVFVGVTTLILGILFFYFLIKKWDKEFESQEHIPIEDKPNDALGNSLADWMM